VIKAQIGESDLMARRSKSAVGAFYANCFTMDSKTKSQKGETNLRQAIEIRSENHQEYLIEFPESKHKFQD
jgi:hypothetical protein